MRERRGEMVCADVRSFEGCAYESWAANGRSTRWFVLHTKPQQEKALARECAAKGIDSYLPVRKEFRYHGRQRQIKEFPLFPGYLFQRGTIEQTYVAASTRRVVRIIPVADQRRIEWALEEMANPVMPSVERPHILGLEPLHSSPQRVAGELHGEVKMIRHEHVRREDPAVLVNASAQQLE